MPLKKKKQHKKLGRVKETKKKRKNELKMSQIPKLWLNV
jgi:hypothetical protein